MKTIPDTIVRYHVSYTHNNPISYYATVPIEEDSIAFICKTNKSNLGFKCEKVSFEVNKEEKELLIGLYEYAINNYNKDGWDCMIESWDDLNMLDEIREHKFSSLDKAIEFYQKVCKMLDDRRKDMTGYLNH